MSTPLENKTVDMFYTYVIQSKKDGKWYTGCTSDLRKRFRQHHNNEVLSTKGRGPFELIYYEACINEIDAFARERYLKSGPGKHYLKNRLKRFLSLTGSSAKLWKTKFSKISQFFLIFIIIFAWIFSGWPQIWKEPPAPLNKYLSGPFPPDVNTARAATTTIFLITGTTWAVPTDWNNTANTIEVIGGGGGGQGVAGSSAGGGAGAGGGAYSKITNATLTAGATVGIAVGTAGTGGANTGAAGTAGGDTFLCNATTNCASIAGTAVIVGAKGGSGGATATGGAGGAAASGVGTTKNAGGTGGNGGTSAAPNDGSGGGGGGAGGTTAAGSNGAAGAAGVAIAGGAGGAGGTVSGGTAGAAGGAACSPVAGVGGNGTVWDATHGAGGGGGGGGQADSGGTCQGGAGGNYGGGGGGGGGNDGAGGNAGGNGVAGLIVIAYTPAVASTLTFVVSTNVFPTLTSGSPVFATSTLSVNTNNSTGWNVTVSRDTAVATMALNTDTTVKITDQTDWIPNAATTTAGNAVRISSLINAQKALAFRVMTASGTASFISTAWWGTTDAYLDSVTTLWAGIASSTAANLKIGNSSVSSGGAAVLNTVLYYLDVPSTQQSGAYSGGITYTATMNP